MPLEVVEPFLVFSKDVNNTIIECSIRKFSINLLPSSGRHAVLSLEHKGEEYPEDQLITSKGMS